MDDTAAYDMWFKQSQDFYKSAEAHLKNFFETQQPFNPEQHLEAVQQWLAMLRDQWQQQQLGAQQQQFAEYWQRAANLSNEAADLMLKEWIKRTQQNEPIQNIRELYELWIQCCHTVYERAMQTKAYQETFGKWMNDALKFWSQCR